MPSIPSIEIFARHSRNCPHRGDEGWKRCRCRKHLRWTWEGQQHRQSTKSREWAGAERVKRELELKYEAALFNRPAEDDVPATVSQAIEIFMADKKGGKADSTTLSKYEKTLIRFRSFCDHEGLHFIREVKLQHLSKWRESWSEYYDSNFSLRNNQSRLRHFFRYCHNAGLTQENPASKLSPIKVTDDDYEVNPFTEQEYESILKAIPLCDTITAINRERVDAMMQLQRWSGLSLVDAVCLHKVELLKDGSHYRVDTSRRKTGSRVNNVIPRWLGEKLLRLKNSNEQYFFWSGKSTPKSATSIFDKLYRKVFAKSKVVNATSHRFRHTFAVSLLEKGVDIRIVSKALGHKNLAVTERHYAKWSAKQQATLAEALSSTWDKKAARAEQRTLSARAAVVR